MGQGAALKLAIDLFQCPTRAPSLREAPLPSGVLDVVRVAAGDNAAISQAVELTGRSRQVVREAAGFFVEQVMLYPGADSYRVLGAKPDASHRELRRNMAVLLRWLHPDTDAQGERIVFSSRVTEAWDNLKTAERRAAYDRSRRTRRRSQRSSPQRPKSSNLRPTMGRTHQFAHSVPRESSRAQGYGRYHQHRLSPIDVYKENSLFHRLFALLFGKAWR